MAREAAAEAATAAAEAEAVRARIPHIHNNRCTFQSARTCWFLWLQVGYLHCMSSILRGPCPTDQMRVRCKDRQHQRRHQRLRHGFELKSCGTLHWSTHTADGWCPLRRRNSRLPYYYYYGSHQDYPAVRHRDDRLDTWAGSRWRRNDGRNRLQLQGASAEARAREEMRAERRAGYSRRAPGSAH